MNENKRFCPAMWLSGFFGLGFAVHLLRLILRVPVTIGEAPISMALSGVIVVVFGLLSVGLLVLSLKRPCDKKSTICGHRKIE